jgi:hypothetical protein
VLDITLCFCLVYIGWLRVWLLLLQALVEGREGGYFVFVFLSKSEVVLIPSCIYRAFSSHRVLIGNRWLTLLPGSFLFLISAPIHLLSLHLTSSSWIRPTALSLTWICGATGQVSRMTLSRSLSPSRYVIPKPLRH